MTGDVIEGAGFAALFDRPGRIRPPRREWRRALSALRKLLNDNQDTVQVFEIMRALNHGSARKGFLRLIDKPTGARIAYERVELAARLMDRTWLETFADGSVGAIYRDFVTREQLSAAGLAEVSAVGIDPQTLNRCDPVAWYGRRIRDIHDLWHIITGYGRDPLGEACLVAFSFGQTRGLGWLAIAIGAYIRGGKGRVPGVRAAIFEGFRHSRHSVWLPGVDYERLMGLPLDRARAELNLSEPVRYRKALMRLSGHSTAQ